MCLYYYDGCFDSQLTMVLILILSLLFTRALHRVSGHAKIKFTLLQINCEYCADNESRRGAWYNNNYNINKIIHAIRSDDVYCTYNIMISPKV